jgi:hypothetical protein
MVVYSPSDALPLALCCGLGDAAGSYTTASIIPGFLEAGNSLCLALHAEVLIFVLLNAVIFFERKMTNNMFAAYMELT